MSCKGCKNGSGCTTGGCKSSGGGGCATREVHDWLAGIPLPGAHPLPDAVELRFKGTRRGFYRFAPGMSLVVGEAVTVEASTGYDIGVVCLAGELVRAQMLRKGAGTDTYGLRKILHRSTQQEIDTWHAARAREHGTMLEARRICREAGLDMKVSDVEFQGDGTRATVYYTAEQRVDFREVVRKIAECARARIDMKQIGARQEAARLGGLGPSGRELCSSTWLTDLRSVTTSAARYQQLALNPQKLAGLCGKLKCCLNFELDMYMEAIKSYPSPNAKLKTRQGTGVHMKTDIFKEKMWYMFKRSGEPVAMAAFPVETVREILAQNKQGIEPEVDLHMMDEPESTGVDEVSTEYANVIDGAEDLGRFDKKLKSAGKGRRRDGTRKKRTGTAPRHAAESQDRPQRPRAERTAPEDRPARPAGEGRSRDHRGRRRKGNKPGGQGPAAAKPSNA